MKRKLKTGAVLAFLAALIILFAHPDYRNGESSLRGHSAKDFAFTLDGKPAHLSDLRGKVVVLNFWASWCPPCVEETPSLVALQKDIEPLGGTVLGVDVDVDESESGYDAGYDNFLKTYHVDFPTYLDSSKRIALDYGTTMYPETYIINRDGNLDRKIIGPQNWTSPAMISYLDSLLKVP